MIYRRVNPDQLTVNQWTFYSQINPVCAVADAVKHPKSNFLLSLSVSVPLSLQKSSCDLQQTFIFLTSLYILMLTLQSSYLG